MDLNENEGHVFESGYNCLTEWHLFNCNTSFVNDFSQ